MLNFSPATNDQSLYFLGRIFGNVGIALSGVGPPILSQMFQTFNTTLLIVGALIVAYVTVVGVIQTAAEGEFLGKKWHSVWVPIRTVLGIIGLMPTGSGYCAMQVIMMWIIVQGVWMADTVWKTTLNSFRAGGTLFMGANTASLDDVGKKLPETLQKLFANLACQAAIVKIDQNDPYANIPTSGPYSTTYTQTATEASYVFGENGICGRVTWSAPSSAKDRPAMFNAQTQAMQDILPMFAVLANTYVTKVMTSGTNNPECWRVSCVPTQIDKTATDYCNYFGKFRSFDPNCSWIASSGLAAKLPELPGGANFMIAIPQRIYGYANNYVQQALFSQGKTTFNSTKEKAFNKSEAEGWIFAGTLYYSIAQQTNMGAEDYQNFINGIVVEIPPAVMEPKPKIEDLPLILQQHDFLVRGEKSNGNSIYQGAVNIAAQAIRVAQEATKLTGGIQMKSSGGVSVNSAANKYLWKLDGVAEEVVSFFVKSITPSMNEDPLVRLQKFGHSLLDLADELFSIFLWTAVGLGFLSLVCVFFGTTCNPVQGMATVVSNYLLPVFIVFFGYLIIIGGAVGIYFPLIPYILFSFAAIGWFIGVIEAMVAAPIVALGLLSPTGQHEILGRAEHAGMIIMNLFLRPTLMIFGLIASMLLAIVVVIFINTAFYTVVAQMTGGSVGILEAFLFLIAYAALLLSALNKSYSLIHYIPAQVLTWIGGHAKEYGEEAAASQVKERVSTGTKSVSREASAAGKGAVGGGAAMAGAAADWQKAKEEEKKKDQKTPGVSTKPKPSGDAGDAKDAKDNPPPAAG